MYPRISDIFRDLFGVNLPFSIYSFGFMVAVAVAVGIWLTGKEFERYHALGKLTDKPLLRRGEAIRAADLTGSLAIIVIAGGFLGSRVFHILENIDTFARDPWGMIFTTGGFTFYGGLIVAGALIAWWVRRNNLHVRVVADSIAPSLMLGYGIGRIGCHLAGDGDWGITSNLAGKPGFLPDWLWAETYPNNILGRTLDAPVYPTPIYEFVAAVFIFAVLWKVRKHPFVQGWLFSLYLALSGLERFLIEKIRVNNEFSLLGINVTQAEIISTLLILLGVTGMILTRKRSGPKKNKKVAVPETLKEAPSPN